jgi:hypothetical protein
MSMRVVVHTCVCVCMCVCEYARQLCVSVCMYKNVYVNVCGGGACLMVQGLET